MAAATSQGVEEEAPSAGITEEADQPMQGVQETFQLPASQGSQSEHTSSPIKIVLPQMRLSTKTLGAHLHLDKLVSFILL